MGETTQLPVVDFDQLLSVMTGPDIHVSGGQKHISLWTDLWTYQNKYFRWTGSKLLWSTRDSSGPSLLWEIKLWLKSRTVMVSRLPYLVDFCSDGLNAGIHVSHSSTGPSGLKLSSLRLWFFICLSNSWFRDHRLPGTCSAAKSWSTDVVTHQSKFNPYVFSPLQWLERNKKKHHL